MISDKNAVFGFVAQADLTLVTNLENQQVEEFKVNGFAKKA